MRANWADFYEALADRIGGYTGQELLDLARKLSESYTWLGYLHFEDARLWQERGHSLDPFTFMGSFNRGQTDEHRREIAGKLAAAVGVRQTPPECYHGIPYLDPRHSAFADANAMWALYRAATAQDKDGFSQAWNKAIAAHGNGLGTLSIGLFWVRPYEFMAVDRISSPYIQEITGILSPHEKCSGADYEKYLAELSARLKAKALNYPEVAFAAWQESHPGKTC